MAKKNSTRFSNSARIENRRARHDYEVMESVEAGIQLTGCEVKSLRQGHGSLAEVYATPRGSELFLHGMHIKPYEEGGREAPDAYRERKLLLHKREIDRLLGAVSQKGMTLIPLKLYFNERGFAKVEIGVCRGKKTHDKRATIKERQVTRELQREYKLR